MNEPVAVAAAAAVLTAAAPQIDTMASHRIAFCALALLACVSIAQAANTPAPTKTLAR